MNILFLTIYRITNIFERGIYTDLMREFIRLGHEVYIVTPSERRYNEKSKLQDGHNFHILSVRSLNLQKTNFIEKGFGQLLLEKQYKRSIIHHWKNVVFDVILYSTPPITFNNIIGWQKKLGAKTYLMLKDIFPQNAVDLQMMDENGLLYKFFKKQEKRLYELSDWIGCMSPANIEYIISHNPSIPSCKVEICPNSISPIKNLFYDKKRSTLKKYGFSNDKPVFLYGGNLGKPQGVDFLIKILDSIINKDVNVCIVGSGTEKYKLDHWIVQNPHAKNIVIMESLPRTEYDQLVSIADVGLIFLDRRFTIPNFPSRLLSYLEFKKPVLIASDTSTDIGKIARDNGFGLWCKSGDIAAFLDNMQTLCENRNLREQMGETGYRFLFDNYHVKNTANLIMSHFQNNC